jgi:sugar porter (SP) family MFS transporter
MPSLADPLMPAALEMHAHAKGAAGDAAGDAAPPPLPAVVYAFIGVAAGANLLFGFENSIISGARTAYAAETGLDVHGAAYGFLASALPAGATVACLFAGFFQELLGRRRTLALCCAAYTAAALVSFLSASYAQLAAGRVLTGLSIGVFSSTAPMYIAELSPPAQRGQLVTVNQVCICTGVLLGYLASAVVPSLWRVQLICGAPLAVVLCGIFLFAMPFSPRWLMTKGREEEARAVLERLRAGEAPATIAAELDGIREACASMGGEGASERFWAKLRERHVLWSITIGVVAATMQQWSGVNAVNMYTSDVFKAAGFSGALLTQLPILIGVAKLVFVIVALALMDRVGRKPLLLVGCAGMVVSLALLGFALRPSPVPQGLGILATAALCLYVSRAERAACTCARARAGPPNPKRYAPVADGLFRGVTRARALAPPQRALSAAGQGLRDVRGLFYVLVVHMRCRAGLLEHECARRARRERLLLLLRRVHACKLFLDLRVRL